jgi:hypothetical protein
MTARRRLSKRSVRHGQGFALCIGVALRRLALRPTPARTFIVFALIVTACGGLTSGSEPQGRASAHDGAIGPMSDTGEATWDASRETQGLDSDTDAVPPDAWGSSPIDVSTLRGVVPMCPSGHAHANVCCVSGPRQPTVCLERLASPFQSCDQGSMTFPDPRTCCPINGVGACIEADEPSDASAVGTCSFPCAPVAYSPEELPSDSPVPLSALQSCSNPDSGDTCLSCCYGGLGECVTYPCSCPASGPCLCGTSCGSCPSGWQPPASGQDDLCCRTSQDGMAQCFSQADSIHSPAGGSYGSPTTCEWAQTGSDGHYHDAWCDPSETPVCRCAIDGKTTQTIAKVDCRVLFISLCGFPPDP